MTGNAPIQRPAAGRKAGANCRSPCRWPASGNCAGSARENLGEEPLDLPPSDLQTTGYWLAFRKRRSRPCAQPALWTNAPNDYGPGWTRLREAVRQRDGFRCQVCGTPEGARQHDVHHKVPFRAFPRRSRASCAKSQPDSDNLITLCPACHRKAEQNVRMRSGLAGLGSVLGQLGPLFLMCDPGDLGIHIDPIASHVFGQPAIVIYDLSRPGSASARSCSNCMTNCWNGRWNWCRNATARMAAPPVLARAGRTGWAASRKPSPS